MYLACLGLDAGANFFDTVFRPEGLLWIGVGFALTVIPVLIMGIIALRWSKVDFGSVAGMLCGSMANPMALNYVNDTIPGDNPSVAYATVYPLSMATLEIKIIVRTVKVGRHYRYVVCAVLQVEAFAHFQSGYFSYGIRFIGIFQRRSEQCILFHRLLGITRINTGATQEKQFLYIMTEAFPYDILLYLQVLVDEIGTVYTVCHESTRPWV